MKTGLAVSSFLVIMTFTLAGCTDLESSGADKKELAGTAKDGAKATATNATATLLRSDKQDFEGTIAAGTQDPASGATTCGAAGREGVDQMTFAWTITDKEADGTASVVKKAVIKLAGTTPTTLDIDLFVFRQDGTEVSSSTSGEPSETIELANGLPAGAYQLRVTACNAAAIQFTLQAVADYYAVA